MRARQLDAMAEFWVVEKNIIVEKMSGKRFRPSASTSSSIQKSLGAEDVPVVKSMVTAELGAGKFAI